MCLEEYTCKAQATFIESAFHKEGYAYCRHLKEGYAYCRHHKEGYAYCRHQLSYDTKMVKNVEEIEQWKMHGADDPYTKNVSQFMMWLYNQVVKSKL